MHAPKGGFTGVDGPLNSESPAEVAPGTGVAGGNLQKVIDRLGVGDTTQPYRPKA